MGIDLLFWAVVLYYACRNTTEDIVFKATGQDPPSFRRREARRKERAARRKRRADSPTGKFFAHEWEEALKDAEARRSRKREEKRRKRAEKWEAEDAAREAEKARQAAEEAREAADRTAADKGDERARPVDPAPEPATQAPEPAPEPARPGPEPVEEEPARRIDLPPVEPARDPAPQQATDPWTTDPWDMWPGDGEPLHDPRPAQPANDPEPVYAGARIIPINRPDRPAVDSASTEGDTVNPNGTGTVVPAGEYGGYEATVAGWEGIRRLAAQLDAAYEQQIAALRALNADSRTLTLVAAAREANELHAAAAADAHKDWVNRHGSVKEVKDATGARGDQAMYQS